MLEIVAKEVSLSTVLGKVLSTVWFFVHYRHHANRYKLLGVVVMLTIDVGVGVVFGLTFDIESSMS